MSVHRRPIGLSFSDCRILRAAICEFRKHGGKRYRVNATSTHLDCLNRKLSELWPGQAVGGFDPDPAIDEAQERDERRGAL